MLVFIDFEASSLSDRSYPIEVGWAFEDGGEESHLIRPAPAWTEWDPRAESIHGIEREQLEREGEPHDMVARRMVDVLTGHDLRASAPSWDGKWLSALLRAAGLPRHAIRLKDSDEVLLELAVARVGAERAPTLLKATEPDLPPAHRALPDARVERARWLAIRDWRG